MAKESFTILGGGIAGLASALALAKAGHQVEVLERATAFDPLGAGIQLGPNAVRALQKIGAWDSVAPISRSPPALHFRNGQNGRLLKAVPLDGFEHRFGQPYRVAHRAELHEALLRQVRSDEKISLRMGVDVKAQDLSGRVIAADGIWSKTRQALFPGSRLVNPDVVAFRALIDMPKVDGVDLSCPNNWFFPGGHVVHYPVGRAGKLNIVVIAPEPSPQAHFSRAHPKLLQILGVVPAFTKWPLAYVEPLASWHDNKVMLVGDAAHGVLPYVAQGAAMCLEDAATFVDTTDFATFEERRKPRSARLLRQTLATGKIYHLGGLKRVMRDLAFSTSSPAKLLDRMAWIYAGPAQ